MYKILNSFFVRSLIIIVIAISSLNIFIWEEIYNYNISTIKESAHLKVKSALKIIDYKSFINKDKVQLEKDAYEIKEITELRITIIGPDGIILGDSEVPFDKLDEMGNHITRPEVEEALRTNIGFKKRRSATLGENFYYYCETVKHNGKIIGFVRLALFGSGFDKNENFVLFLIIVVDIIFLSFIIFLLLFIRSLNNAKINSLYSNLEDRKRLKNYDAIPNVGYPRYNDIIQVINIIFENFNIQTKELKEENKHLLNIIDSLSEGIAVFHSNGTLSFCNNNFPKILDLSNDFETDANAYSILTFPPMLNDIKFFNESRENLSRKTKYYKDKYIEYTIEPFQINGDDEGFIIVVCDVTKINKLETVRTDFVANVSHEFKTPLTSIRGYAETLMSGNVEDEKTKLNFLNKIYNQSIYLENLVYDLLNLSRIEKNEVDNIERIDITPILSEIVSEFKIKSKNKKIRFNYKTNCKKECYVKANSNLIHNIVTNLISNAIQYSDENGEINFNVNADQNKIYIEVKDNGIGISEKDKARIFERFYRTKKASSVYVEGTGLGLSIVKNAVEFLEGKFGFESEEEKGSKFWIELNVIK
ncbi:MAG: hypothetical protein CO128_05310 [Ignavibacteriales bacterium CG_4_9_14_3_um_filter_30_11]|nr:MAG: hypothetical protein CO128_05310 [Ignavibacteriales bacterium CG_4_9_14_3_um_filter_30_11]